MGIDFSLDRWEELTETFRRWWDKLEHKDETLEILRKYRVI